MTMVFLLYFIVSLFFHYLNAMDSLNYTIAVVFEKDTELDFDIPKVGPSIDMGIKKMSDMLSQYLNIKIVRSYRHQEKGQCTASGYGTLMGTLFYDHYIDGIIGPGCSLACEVVGRMSADWNLPLISPVATDDALANKNNMKTLTRMSYNLVKFTNFYKEVFVFFNWTDASVLFDEDYTNGMFADHIKNGFTANDNLTATLVKFNPEEDVSVTKAALLEASHHSRIIFVKMSGDNFRRLMLMAHRLGMTNGEYAFIYLNLFEDAPGGSATWQRNDEFDEVARKSCECVLLIHCRTPDNAKFWEFEKEIKLRSQHEYKYNWSDTPVNLFVTAAHDSFVLYATALLETIYNGEDPFNGTNVLRRMWGRMFEGVAGTIAIDDLGDRDADFSLMDYIDPQKPVFKEVGYYLGWEKKFKLTPGVSIHWPNNHGPPQNKPRCGFNGDAPECQSYAFPLVGIIGIAFVSLFTVMTVIGGLIYRKLRLEYELQSIWWKIKWEDISMHAAANSMSRSKLSCGLSQQQSDDRSRNTQIFTRVATYKGTTVAMRNLYISNLQIARETLLEMKQMRDINCSNLTKFQGICTDDGHICIVNEYCSRGSLQDILQNDSIKLDKDFKISLVNDIVQGMIYIHRSPILVHGRLNSSNSVIDSRFVLKITDFGLRSIRTQERKTDNENMRNLLWVAPEHIRTDPHKDFSQQGDVFSFGIILYEIVSRSDPYEMQDTMTVEEIIAKVKTKVGAPFRPKHNELFDEREVTSLMKTCWNENPEDRHGFQHIRYKLKEAKWGETGGNVLDKLMTRMEYYANNLEGLVEERTHAFLEEKRKSEELLYNILPKSIAEKLKNGETVDPEGYTSVTIYFSDIVGFANISAESTPIQVVNLLNDLYTCFDTIIEHYDVYKVETVGDAYMVVSGLPKRNGTEHVRQIARMSLSILSNVQRFKIRHRPDDHLRARIGLHTGSVCAGVVGRKMPRYCLFGDTVNTASRMESNGKAMKIHISSSTNDVLESFKTFKIIARGNMEIKGKGLMRTYWLVSENEDDVDITQPS